MCLSVHQYVPAFYLHLPCFLIRISAWWLQESGAHLNRKGFFSATRSAARHSMDFEPLLGNHRALYKYQPKAELAGFPDQNRTPGYSPSASVSRRPCVKSTFLAATVNHHQYRHRETFAPIIALVQGSVGKVRCVFSQCLPRLKEDLATFLGFMEIAGGYCGTVWQTQVIEVLLKGRRE